MLIATLFSLLGIGCYAYVLAVMLLTRQELTLLWTVACGCLAFGLAARVCLKRGYRVLCVLHGLVAAIAAGLFVALLLLGEL